MKAYFSIFLFLYVLFACPQGGSDVLYSEVGRMENDIKYNKHILKNLKKQKDLNLLNKIKLSQKKDSLLKRLHIAEMEYEFSSIDLNNFEVDKQNFIKEISLEDLAKLGISSYTKKSNKRKRIPQQQIDRLTESELKRKKNQYESIQNQIRKATIKSEKAQQEINRINQAISNGNFDDLLENTEQNDHVIDTQILGLEEEITENNGLVDEIESELSKIKDYVKFNRQESYIKFAASILKELNPIIKEHEKNTQLAFLKLAPKEEFESNVDYINRTNQGNILLINSQNMYQEKIKALETKYLQKEYDQVIVSLIKTSIKTEIIENVTITDYSLDKESYTITFECCIGKRFVVKEKILPVILDIFLESPEKITGTIISKLDQNGIDQEYGNGILKHPEVDVDIPIGNIIEMPFFK